jgi:hypothetical protein
MCSFVARAVHRTFADRTLAKRHVPERALVFHFARFLVEELGDITPCTVDVDYGSMRKQHTDALVSKSVPAAWRSILGRDTGGPAGNRKANLIPDVIVHERGSGRNELALEVKVDSPPAGARLTIDIAKAVAYRIALNYANSAVINFSTSGTHSWLWLSGEMDGSPEVPPPDLSSLVLAPMGSLCVCGGAAAR